MGSILYPIHFRRNFEQRWASRMAGSATRRSPVKALISATADMPGDRDNSPTGAVPNGNSLARATRARKLRT